MPRVRRRRSIQSPPQGVWDYATNPKNLSRWWPRTTSVRDVSGSGQTVGSRWTQVLQAKSGKRIGADLICTVSEPPTIWRFEQETEGTPFERMMRTAWTEMRVCPDDGGSEVQLELGQRLRGLSRLGALFVRSASVKTAEEALEALETALTGKAEGSA